MVLFFLLAYKLSLKLAMSWQVSKSCLPQGRNPRSHILTEQRGAKPVSGGNIKFRSLCAPPIVVWPCAGNFISLAVSLVVEKTEEMTLSSA